MEGNHHVKSNSIIYSKGAIHRVEKERLFLALKGINTNLVHFLLVPHFIISNVHVYSFTCTIFHVHSFVCFVCRKYCVQIIIIYEGLYYYWEKPMGKLITWWNEKTSCIVYLSYGLTCLRWSLCHFKVMIVK